MKLRVAGLLVLLVVAGALVTLAWRAWDPPTTEVRFDPAQAQVVQQLRYQNCLLRAEAIGSSAFDKYRETTVREAAKCKRP